LLLFSQYKVKNNFAIIGSFIENKIQNNFYFSLFNGLTFFIHHVILSIEILGHLIKILLKQRETTLVYIYCGTKEFLWYFEVK
jgi:hypothetical protein